MKKHLGTGGRIGTGRLGRDPADGKTGWLRRDPAAGETGRLGQNLAAGETGRLERYGAARTGPGDWGNRDSAGG